MKIKHGFMIIGHRGCEGLAAENSIYAFQKAIELHVDAAELDVRITADKKLVVFHDKMVKLDSRRVPVESLRYEQLLSILNADESRVPQLLAVLNTCRNRIAVQIEIKSKRIEGLVWDLIRKARFPLDQVSFSSFKFGILKKIRRHAGGLEPHQFVYLFAGGFPLTWILHLLKLHGIGAISLKYKSLTVKKVATCHRFGFRVLAYGVKDKNLIEEQQFKVYEDLIINKNVDGFTTAFPDRVQRFLSGLESR
ncbi:MAG: glycerophosphodiester phosphodiesterase [Promethearchaeota archaeon]